MLLLDSEALSAIARGPVKRRQRVLALVAEMRRRDLPVAISAAVLAEVVRGKGRDAAVFAGLRRERVEVHPVDSRVAVRAGQLLGRLPGGASDLAVDAFVVATADVTGGAIVATVDAADMRRLAATTTNVSVIDVS